MYEEWGGAPAAARSPGLRPRRGTPRDDHRQRRHGESRRVLPDDREESDPRAEHRHRKSHSRRSTWSIPPAFFCRLQEDVFPDTDDFGRVFRNNAVMSAMGIPQIAAIMGMCVAGGAYLPVMCDHILMTEGSGLFLAGPALVQAAIGQKTPPKNWAARKCTRKSAAPLISASRMTTPASSAFARSWTKWAIRPPRRSITKPPSRPPIPPKKSTAFSLPIRRSNTTCAK